MRTRSTLRAALFAVFLATLAPAAHAFWNPITELGWMNVTPIKIGGATVLRASTFDVPEPASPACACYIPPFFVRVGFTLSMWTPERLIETVKTPWYFPTLDVQIPISGFNFGSIQGGTLGGTAGPFVNDQMTYINVHYVYFPIWSILELFMDAFCVQIDGSMDYLFLSEVDPIWNDENASAFLFPETFLFANPYATLPCMADAVATNLYAPLPFLFWCVGGTPVYPLTGNIRDERIADADYTMAARLLYVMNRLLLHHDPAIDACYAVPTLIWHKWHYKMHIARPVFRQKAQAVGVSSIFRPASNPPFGTGRGPSDEFLWVTFYKLKCCFGITL